MSQALMGMLLWCMRRKRESEKGEGESEKGEKKEGDGWEEAEA